MSESRIIHEFAALESFFPGADAIGLSLLITFLSKDLEKYLELHPEMRVILDKQKQQVSEFLDAMKPVDPSRN